MMTFVMAIAGEQHRYNHPFMFVSPLSSISSSSLHLLSALLFLIFILILYSEIMQSMSRQVWLK